MIQKTDIIKAIISINPNAEVTVEGEDYNKITWYNNTPEISKADIQAKQQELDALEETKAQTQADLKTSAKAKLIAGEPLTEEEADTIVL